MKRSIGQFYSLGKHGLFVLALVSVYTHDIHNQYGYVALIKITDAKNAPRNFLSVNVGCKWASQEVRTTTPYNISDFEWSEITNFNPDDCIEYLGDDLNVALAKFNEKY